MTFRGWAGAAGLGACLLGSLAAGSLAAPALAQDPTVNLKISIWLPPAHPLVPATRAWAADIEKASGGTIKSTIFPSEQLGKAFDHYDMARDGIADVSYVNPGYQPGRFPVIAAGQIPFIFNDGHKGTRALDGWYRAYAAAEMKDTKFCFAFIHDPGSIHAKKKVTLPGDLKGMKLRPAQSTIGQFDTLLGATNVQGSAPEARDMLDRGVAEAIWFPWGSVFLFGIDKAVRYHVDEPLYATVFTYNINKATYDGMTPSQKKVMDDHCTPEWAEKVAGPWIDFEAAGRAKMRELAGHEVYRLTPDQLTQWKKAAEPLTKQWADAVRKSGVDPDAAMAAFKDSLAKNNAAY